MSRANSTSSSLGRQSAPKVNRRPEPAELTSTAKVCVKCGTSAKRKRNGPTSSLESASYSSTPKALLDQVVRSPQRRQEVEEPRAPGRHDQPRAGRAVGARPSGDRDRLLAGR